MLEDERVVHVRGTPASGKSTLAHLLYLHYQKQNTASVIIRSWPNGDGVYADDRLIRYAQSAGYSFITSTNLYDADIVWIIDEAQMSYDDDALWLGFIKFQHGRSSWGPRICVFSSYGSPTGGPQDFSVGSPLAYLGVQQRISITPSRIQGSPSIALFYSHVEFDDVLHRICNDYKSPLPLDPDAADYIFSLTSGHPGAVNGILSMLKKVRLRHSCPCSIISANKDSIGVSVRFKAPENSGGGESSYHRDTKR